MYVTAKANLKDRIARSEAKGADWLEPLETFVNRCKQAKRVAFSENLEELKESLQLIGSNLVLTGPIDEDDPASPRLRRTSARRDEDSEPESSLKRGDRPAGPPVLKEMVGVPSLPVHVPILGTSTFSIPETAKRADRQSVGASRINRRRLPVVCVRFPKPFQFLAHSAKNPNWRRGWDSNPRSLAAQRFSRPPRSSTPAPLLVVSSQ